MDEMMAGVARGHSADERLRPDLLQSPEELRKHVALILVSLVLTTQAEWLARRAAGEQRHLAPEIGEVQVLD